MCCRHVLNSFSSVLLLLFIVVLKCMIGTLWVMLRCKYTETEIAMDVINTIVIPLLIINSFICFDMKQINVHSRFLKLRMYLLYMNAFADIFRGVFYLILD